MNLNRFKAPPSSESFRYSRGWVDTRGQRSINERKCTNVPPPGRLSERPMVPPPVYASAPPSIPPRSPTRPSLASSLPLLDGSILPTSNACSKSNTVGKRLSVDTQATNDSAIEVESRKGSLNPIYQTKGTQVDLLPILAGPFVRQQSLVSDVAAYRFAGEPSSAEASAVQKTEGILNRVSTRSEEVQQESELAQQQGIGSELRQSASDAPHLAGGEEHCNFSKIPTPTRGSKSSKIKKPSLAKRIVAYTKRISLYFEHVDEKDAAKYATEGKAKEAKWLAKLASRVEQRDRPFHEAREVRRRESAKRHEDVQHNQRRRAQERRRRLKKENMGAKQEEPPTPLIEISAPLSHEEELAIYQARTEIRPQVSCDAVSQITFADQP